MHPAKTQISLGIRPIWSVFAVRMKKAWILSYPLSTQRRLWSDWVDAQADVSLHWVQTHLLVLSCRGSISNFFCNCWNQQIFCLKDERNSDRNSWEFSGLSWMVNFSILQRILSLISDKDLCYLPSFVLTGHHKYNAHTIFMFFLEVHPINSLSKQLSKM